MTEADISPHEGPVKIRPKIVPPVSREEARKKLDEQRRIEREKAEALAAYEREMAEDSAFDHKLREAEARKREFNERVQIAVDRNADIEADNERRLARRKRIFVFGGALLLVAVVLKTLEYTLMAGW